VILHGGRASAEERAAALDLGAFDVLAPLPGEAELRARLRAALRVRERMDLLERRAYRDSLTGLINRGALEDQLRRYWDASRRHGTSLSVLIVDLDRFKEINDAHGHPAGDEALRRTAAVLTRSVRRSDIVARYSGDEFVVIAPACPPESATLLALRFRAGLAAPIKPAIPLTLSIGIAGTDGPEPARLDDLLQRADQALYFAKRSGRDAVAVFDPSRGAPTLVVSR
jgi:diguanylate cyclase (GGDEF)-like protein